MPKSSSEALRNPVVFVVNDYGFLMSHRKELVKRAVAQADEVWVYAANLPKDPPQGVRLREFPLKQVRLSLFDALKTVRVAVRASFTFPDAVFHLITILPILLFGVPLRLCGRRVVFALSGLGSVFSSTNLGFRLIRPVISSLYRFLFNGRKSRVIVQNEEDESFLLNLGVNPRNIHKIRGSGVDASEFPFRERNELGSPPTILVPARLIKEKGIYEAVEASRILQGRGIDHEMIFAGDIHPANPHSLTREEKEALARQNPQIRFLGHVRDMSRLLDECDLVCLPTYREGLPKALIEAFASGRAVVSYDTVGVREIVKHGVNGLLAPLKSTVELADALAALLRDSALRNSLRLRAVEDFRRSFRVEDVIEETFRLYRDLMGVHPSMRPLRSREGHSEV